MHLEYYVILIIKIASCLGQQYAFRSDSASANMMCSAEKVQFSTTSINDISCVRACSLTQNCHAVIFYHGNKTCFGLNTDDPFNESIPLPGAVFYKLTIAMSQRSARPSTTTAPTTAKAPTTGTTAPPTTTTIAPTTGTTALPTVTTPPQTTTTAPPTTTTAPPTVTTAQPTTTKSPPTVTTAPTTTITSAVIPVLFPPGVNSYGEQYPNNADETTTFTAPEGKRVLLTFGGVEIECEVNANCWPLDDGYSCPHDYLDIMENGVSTSRICGSSPEYVYQSTASSVTVRFHTDYGTTYRGYQLNVAYVPAV